MDDSRDCVVGVTAAEATPDIEKACAQGGPSPGLPVPPSAGRPPASSMLRPHPDASGGASAHRAAIRGPVFVAIAISIAAGPPS